MILCVNCNTRKRSENFKIKVKLVSSDVLFKICDNCGTIDDLQKEEWKNEMIDKGALDFQRPLKYYSHYQKTYNISHETYDNMYKEQKGRCKICNKHQMDLNKRLSVDHCHKSGKVRSLLCSNCNAALGLIKENDKTALKLLEYIIEYRGLKR